MWGLVVWLCFSTLEGAIFAIVDGRIELLLGFIFKVVIAAVVWGWAPIEGETKLVGLRVNPNAFFGASQILVGVLYLIAYSFVIILS